MARFVVPVVVLVALVGGYVVGQQPTTNVPPHPFFRQPDAAEHRADQVGRFVAFDDSRILDTASGTLYDLRDNQWVSRATVPATKAPFDLRDRLLKVQEEHAKHIENLLRQHPNSDGLKQAIENEKALSDGLNDLLNR